MISVPTSVPIFLFCGPVDMRKGVSGLSGLVRGELGGDPQDGSLYLFVNRRHDRLKMLYWDGTGYWLFYKLLEAGTFEVVESAEKQVTIDATQLSMLLAGVSLASPRRKRYRKAS